MTVRSLIARVFQQEGLNFLLTNRIPRRQATRLMGWLSRIEQPLVRDISIGIWRLFSDLDLSEAKKTQFKSLHDCFIRELKDGARPVDPDPDTLVSPCDAIVGACGAIAGTDLLQVKGSWYALQDLLGDRELVEFYRDGCYATLRLTAAMYHRFHAPHDCRVEGVTHIWGDTWNVNPIALERVTKLYCRNERVLIRTRLDATDHLVTLVPVAAILVAGIRLRFLDDIVDPRRSGPLAVPCRVPFRKGQEMGWFEHGSTIIVLAPRGFALSETVRVGANIRMGEGLMRVARDDPKHLQGSAQASRHSIDGRQGSE
jgi:phosphatidylserine decarboxylase